MLKTIGSAACAALLAVALGGSAASSQDQSGPKRTTIAAGDWQIVRHFEVSMNDGRPGDPPSETNSLCFSEEGAAEDILSDYLLGMFGGELAPECSFTVTSAAGGRLEMVKTCNSEENLQTIKFSGTYDATQFEVTENETYAWKGSEAGALQRRDRIVGRRTAPSCS